MKVLTICTFIFSLFIFPQNVLSDIIVHDGVVLVGKEIMLKAQVKGKLFSKGGEMIEFFVNGKSIGKRLSGGDGLAFKQFVPHTTGLGDIAKKLYSKAPLLPPFLRRNT